MSTTTASADRKTISPLSSQVESALAELAVAMIHADGLADDLELKVAYDQGGEIGVRRPAIDAAIHRRKAGEAYGFSDVLGAIPHEARGAATALLFEIACADDRLDRREVKLLEAVRDAWNIKLEFLNKPLVWDKDQQAVIESARTAYTIVSAGPGMGKTSVACGRVAHLIEEENVYDGNIWLVSFTRAAIAELGGRISEFSNEPKTSFSVKISTIDSQAWKLRYGFDAVEAEKLFDGFETSISKALELFESRKTNLRDAFADLEHVIVDEAQDITGDRARFLMRLFSLLPKSCGLTIFYDDAQAIYDHTMGEDNYRFVTAFRQAYPGRLTESQLHKIYRTEDPKLLQLYERLRLDILDSTPDTKTSFSDRKSIVTAAAHIHHERPFSSEDILAGETPLVLFRQRFEVARASSYLSKDGFVHRLRMGGLPKVLAPWLALTIGRAKSDSLTFKDFEVLHDEAMSSFNWLMGNEEDIVKRRWDNLFSLGGGRRGTLDLNRLRGACKRKPDTLMLADNGNLGPILGTIHASKGREADNVSLQLAESWGSRKETDFGEESRVLFVGASRARKQLAVTRGEKLPFPRTTESDRIYLPMRGNKYQVYIGLSGDYDEVTALNHQDDIVRSAATFSGPIPLKAELVLGEWTYELGTETQRFGMLGQNLSRDCVEIGIKHANEKGRGAKRSPKWFQHLYVQGYGTAVLPVERPNTIRRDMFGGSGFYLIPLISGFTMAYLY